MKLLYEKPAIKIENFGLSQTIAKSCGHGVNGTEFGKHTYHNINTCGWDYFGTVFWLDSPACDILAEKDMDLGGVCYNNPEGATIAFSS